MTTETREGEGGSGEEQGALDRYFGLSAAGTSIPTELRAGVATFLTIDARNCGEVPQSILSKGNNHAL